MKHDPRDEVRRILDRLDDVIDPDEQENIRRRHTATALWEEVDRPPVLIVPPWDHPTVKLYPVSEAVNDPAKMLTNELRRGFSAIDDWLEVKDDRPLQVRPNFGIGLVASVFGAAVEVVGDNPPWVRPIEENVLSYVPRFLDRFDPSTAHTAGWLPRVAETLDYYRTTFAEYSRVASSVAISLPDLQGPFETAAMIWGSDIFAALITDAGLVDRFVEAVGSTMVHLHAWLRSWIGRELLPDGFSHQHGSIIRGNLLLRCDSNLMMSPEMYERQVFKHDRRVLSELGGGSYHSCGRWKQNIPLVLSAPEVGSIDFGSNQSHMNDIDEVHAMARPGRKHLNLVSVTARELTNRTALERFPTGATLQCLVNTVGSAAQIMREYHADTAG